MRRTSITKHYQIIDLEESHYIIYILRVLLNWVFLCQPWKYLALTSRRLMCGTVFYIRISSESSQRQHWAPILMTTWKRAQSLVIEPTLNAASVAPPSVYDRVPIMTWWLPSLSFSVNIVRSEQHHRVCNKTETKLSTLRSVSSWPSSDYIFATIKRQPCVSVPPILRSDLWESASITFMQTLLTHALAPTDALIWTLLSTSVFIVGLELRRYGWYQQCGLTLYSYMESVECQALRCHSVVGSEQLWDIWMLLRLPADPINFICAGLIFCSHMLFCVIFNKHVQFCVTKVVLKILMLKTHYWSDMPHINYTASEITRFNHQLANLNMYGE